MYKNELSQDRVQEWTSILVLATLRALIAVLVINSMPLLGPAILLVFNVGQPKPECC